MKIHGNNGAQPLSPPGFNAFVNSGNAKVGTSAGALGAFMLTTGGAGFGGGMSFVKPALAGGLGVNQDLLGGMSPTTVLASLLSQTRTQQAEGRRDIINSAVGSAGPAGRSMEQACDNYDVDVGAAVLKWATNPENLETGLKFGAKVIETVVAAVASGGTSLIDGLPALGVAAMEVADDILKESGLSLQQVLGSVATDALIELGVNPEDARKLGPFLASAGIAAAQAYDAVQRGDLSGLDPKVFASLAQTGAVLMGADQGFANAAGMAVGGGLSLTKAFMGGTSEVFNSGNLGELLTSGESIGRQAQLMLGGGQVDLKSMLDELKNFSTQMGRVLGDLEKDTGIPGLQDVITNKAQQHLGDFFKDLGPFAPIVAAGADLLERGFANQRNMI